MSEAIKTVREFSSAGPCLTLGTLVKQTATTITFQESDGSQNKRGGYRLKCGLIHIEACPSCRDHPKTQYPNGLMD